MAITKKQWEQQFGATDAAALSAAKKAGYGPGDLQRKQTTPLTLYKTQQKTQQEIGKIRQEKINELSKIYDIGADGTLTPKAYSDIQKRITDYADQLDQTTNQQTRDRLQAEIDKYTELLRSGFADETMTAQNLAWEQNMTQGLYDRLKSQGKPSGRLKSQGKPSGKEAKAQYKSQLAQYKMRLSQLEQNSFDLSYADKYDKLDDAAKGDIDEYLSLQAMLNNVDAASPAYDRTLNNFTRIEERLRRYGLTEDDIKNIPAYVTRMRNAEQTQQTRQNAADFFEEHGRLASFAAGVGERLLSGVGLFDVAMENLLTAGTDRPVDYNTYSQQFAHWADTITEEQLKVYQERYGDEALDTGIKVIDNILHTVAGETKAEAAGNAYQLLQSMPQSVVIAGLSAIGVPAATVLLALPAGVSAVHQAHEDGYSDGVSFVLGVAAGAIEALTEKFSIEALFSMKNSPTVKATIGNVARQMLSEGSEEIASDIGNFAVDALVNGNTSEFRMKVYAYMQDGMSYQEAQKKAWIDFAVDTVRDGFGGAVSGGVFGIGGTAVQVAGRNIQYAENGQRIIGQDAVHGLLNAATNIDEAIQKQNGMRVTELDGAGSTEADTTSIRSVGKLYTQTQRGLMQQAIGEQVTQRGGKASAELSSAILSKLNGERLSLSERSAYNANKDVADRIIGDMTASAIGLETDTNSWVRENDVTVRDGVVVNGYNMPYSVKARKENATVSRKDTVGGSVGTGEALGDITKLKLSGGNLVAEVRTADGSEDIDVDALDINDPSVSTLVKQAKQFGKHAALFYNMYNSGDDLGSYTRQFRIAYEYGLGSTENSDVSKIADKTPNLSELQRTAAYEAGRNAKTAQNETVKTAKKGSVSLNGGTVNGVHYKAVRDPKHLTAKQKAAVNTAKALAETFGINFVFYESEKVDGRYDRANGVFASNTIYLDVNAGTDQAIVRTMAHELTHFIQANTVMYDELKSFVVEHISQFGNGDTFDALVANKIDVAKRNGHRLTRDEAIDEVVADACEMMLPNSTAVETLARENMTLAKKIYEFIRRFTRAVKRAMEGVTAAHTEARLMMDKASELQALWDAALVDAVHGYNGGISEELQSRVDNDQAVTGEQELQYSLGRDEELYDNAVERNDKEGFVSLRAMKDAEKARKKIRDMFRDPKLKDILKLPPDVEGNTFLDNRSYVGSEENTTVCIRSLAAQAFMDEVSKKLGRPLTVQDTLVISQELANWTDKPECFYCYVATDRRAYRDFLGQYLRQRDRVIEKLNAGETKSSVYEEFLNGKKNTENKRSRFNMWAEMADRGELIPAKDLTSLDEFFAEIDRLSALDTRTDAQQARLDQLKDAAQYAQSASWAKKMIGYAAYNGHILKWTQNRINKINDHYGLRMYSFSDYSPAFILENMQMITDAAVRGLKMLAYTKELDFVRIFAKTGANINISVFAYQQNGQIAEDAMMGAAWAEAQELRAQNPNVGITLVATNDDILQWGLEQDWIDVVIPYHLVRTGASVAEYFGYKNYTSESADTKDKKNGWKKGGRTSVYPSEHNNDIVDYVRALDKFHLAPRFEKYITGWREFLAGEMSEKDFRDANPYYMKLVNETRRTAEQTPSVQPVFDVDAAMASIDEMAKRGGYYVPIGGSQENMEDIAGEVAGKLDEKVQFSERDEKVNWAINNGFINNRNLARFYSAIAEINKLGYNSFTQTSSGEYMIPHENVIMYTDGDFDNPSITKVVCIDNHLLYETTAEDIREFIIYEEGNGTRHGDAISSIKKVCGNESITQYDIEDYRSDGRKNRRREGSNSKRGSGAVPNGVSLLNTKEWYSERDSDGAELRKIGVSQQYSDPFYRERRRSDIESRISELEDESIFSDDRRIANELTKLYAEMDRIDATERREARQMSYQTILDNLDSFRELDLDSIANQYSDSAWDDFDDMSLEDKREALRDALTERMDDMTPIERQSPRNGLYAIDPRRLTTQYSERDEDAQSDRDILANAFEDAAQTDAERKALDTYRSTVKSYEDTLDKLAETRRQIAEDGLTGDELAKADIRARNLQARANKLDRDLVKMEEGNKALGAVLKAEKNITTDRIDTRWKAKWNAQYGKAQDEIAQLRADLRDIRIGNTAAVNAAYDRGKMTGVIQQGITSAKDKARVIEQYEKRIAEKEAKIAELREQRDQKVAEAKQAGRERLEKYRADRAETAGRNKYLKRIEQDATDIQNWMERPDKKGHSVPQFLQKTIAEFLGSIDFISGRTNRFGGATQHDQKWSVKMERMAETLRRIEAYQDGAENTLNADEKAQIGTVYMDISPELVDGLKNFIGENDVVTKLSELDAEALKSFSFLMSLVKNSIRSINKIHANNLYQRLADLGDATITELDAKRRADISLKLVALKNFFRWDTMDIMSFSQQLGEAGASVIDELYDGWLRGIPRLQLLEKFGEDTFGGTDYIKWRKAAHEFKLDSGDVITMTEAQIMELYLLNKREQAQGHIYGGGIQIGESVKKAVKKATGSLASSVNDSHQVSIEDIGRILDTLTDEQRAVADKMQQFTSTTASEWGNEVTMALYLYKGFTETNYWPIRSGSDYVRTSEQSQAQEQGSMYRIKNFGMTKQLTPNASNPIVIGDVFDTFARHTGDMVTYSTLSIPLSDFHKWHNFKAENGKTVKQALTTAFGKEANEFLKNFIKDVNSMSPEGYSTGLINKFMSNAKAASIGANLRVVAQQPTSYFRALAYIDPQFLIRGIGMKGGVEKALEHSPIAVWKDWGFFDLNLGRNVSNIILHDDSAAQKVRNASSWAAGEADKLTWGALWNACELQTRRDHSDLEVGSDAYYEAVNELFDKVVRDTQVVDSIFHRAQIARSTDTGVKNLSAFMSEPLKQVNMIRNAYKSGDTTRAIRTTVGYLLAFVINAAAAAVFDALRDDDEKKDWSEKWVESWVDNMWDQGMYGDSTTSKITGTAVGLLSVTGLANVPIIDNIVSGLHGFDSSDLTNAGINKATGAIVNWVKRIAGESSPNRTLYADLYDTASAISTIAGVPLSNVMRELTSVYNLFAQDNIKKSVSAKDRYDRLYRALDAGDDEYYSRTYETLLKTKDEDTILEGLGNQIKEHLLAGDITDSQAMTWLQQTGAADDENDAYFTIDRWRYNDRKGEEDANYSVYTDVYDAVYTGVGYDAALAEMTDHGYTQKAVEEQIRGRIKEWYQGTATDGRTITDAEAMDMLTKYGGRSAQDAADLLANWDCYNELGFQYSDAKELYLAGDITEAQARKALVEHGGMTTEESQKRLSSWEVYDEYGIEYDDRNQAYIAGEITESELRRMMSEVGGRSQDDIDDTIDTLNFRRDVPEAKDITISAVQDYHEFAEPAGVSKSVWYTIWTQQGDAHGEVDSKGESVPYSKVKKVMPMIDALPITSAQKTAIARAWWGDSTINKYKLW